MVKEKINKSTVVVSKVLKPIKILTVIESRQLLLKICTVLDTCTCGYGYKYTLDAILYCESGNFHCKNFIVDGGYKKINLTKISAHYRSLGLAASVSFPWNSGILRTSPYTGRHLGVHGYRKNALASTISRFCLAKLTFGEWLIQYLRNSIWETVSETL